MSIQPHHDGSPAMPVAPSWLTFVQHLLDGRHTTTGDTLDAGAELAVNNADGSYAYLAGLTRMCRLDVADSTLWIRPVSDGQRRRALQFDDDVTCVTVDGVDQVQLQLWNGQTAHIRQATGQQLDDVKRWDELAYNELAPNDLLELEELLDDTAPDITTTSEH